MRILGLGPSRRGCRSWLDFWRVWRDIVTLRNV